MQIWLQPPLFTEQEFRWPAKQRKMRDKSKYTKCLIKLYTYKKGLLRFARQAKTDTGPAVELGREISSGMTNSDKRLRKDVRAVKDSLLEPKALIRIGAWNVRTMFEISKLAKVLREMSKYSLALASVVGQGLDPKKQLMAQSYCIQATKTSTPTAWLWLLSRGL